MNTIKSIIIIAAFTQTTLLMPMATHSVQQQSQQLKFYWGKEKLGSITAANASTLSSLFKAQTTVALDQQEVSKDAAYLFVQLLSLVQENQDKSPQSTSKQISAETSPSAAAKLMQENQNLFFDLYRLLCTYKITYFDKDISHTLFSILTDQAWYGADKLPIENRKDLFKIAHNITSNPFFTTNTINFLYDSNVKSAQFRHNNKSFIAVLRDNKNTRLNEYDLNGNEISQIGNADQAQISPDGNYATMASNENVQILKFDPLLNMYSVITNIENDANVKLAQFNPVSERLAIVSDDNTVKIFDKIGKILTTFKHDQINNNYCSVSSDGKYFMATFDDNTLSIFNFIQGKIIATIRHDAKVTSSEFSPSGNYIATVSEDNTVRIFNFKESPLLAENQFVDAEHPCAVIKHTDKVQSISFSIDDRWVVTASGLTAKIFTINGEEIQSFAHTANVQSAKFSPIRKQIITVSGCTARIFEANKEICAIAHDNEVKSAEFSHNGEKIITASGKIVKVLSITGKKILTITPNEESNINSAKFSPKDIYIITDFDNTIKLFKASGEAFKTITQRCGTTGQVEIAKLVLNDNVTFSNNNTNKKLSLQFGPDGRYIDASQIEPVDNATFLNNNTNKISSLQFSPDGKYIATIAGHTTKIFESETGNLIGTINHNHTIRSAKFSSNNQYIVTASDDHTAKISDLQGNLISQILHNKIVRSAEFSPNDQYIVTASDDCTAKIFDCSTKNVIAEIKHNDWVISAQFRNDSKFIITASLDASAKISDLQGNIIKTNNHANHVRSAHFSPDGKYAITTSLNEIQVLPLGIHDMRPDQILAIATMILLEIESHDNKSMPMPLLNNEWIYTTFMELPEERRNDLQKQFPQIINIIPHATRKRTFTVTDSDEEISSARLVRARLMNSSDEDLTSQEENLSDNE